MVTFHVTYEIITEDSAAHGDAAERGYVSPGNWHHDDAADLTLRQAVDLVSRGSMEDAGRWFSDIDGTENYRTGDREYRSLHPSDNITPSSYNRLARILTGKR